MKQQKSAKDIAFDKERDKFRSEIRKLHQTITEKEIKLEEYHQILDEKENLIRQQQEWIERLLQYTELSKEELKQQIENEKRETEMKEHIKTTLGMIGLIGGKTFY